MVDIAALRSKLQELKGKGGNQEFLQKYWRALEFDATNSIRSTIRILPGQVGPGDEQEPFFVETLLHRINGKNIHSPRLLNKPCPIQDYIKKLWAQAEQYPENVAVAREIKARKRFYMNIIARERIIISQETGKEELRKNDGPLIFSCGVKLFEKILKTMIDEEEYGDITSLTQGFDLKVIMEIRDGYPNYDDSRPVRESSPAGTDEQMNNWMLNIHNLKELINIPTYEELENELAIYRGLKEEGSLAPQKDTETDSSSPASEQVQTAVSKAVDETPAKTSSSGSDDEFLEELRRIQQKESK